MALMPSIERSATEARLLALLTSTPGQEFHTRELVRRVSGSPRPVHLALEKLARQGLVESRRVGPLRLWRMDPGHPLYLSLRDLYARTVGIVAQLRVLLEGHKGIRFAFVFGSYARGDDDTRSDIDVFVVGDFKADPLIAATQKLEANLGRELNAVVWTEQDLRRRIQERSPFLATVREEAKIWIVGDEGEFDRRTGELARAVQRDRAADQPRSARRGAEARAGRAKPRTSAAPTRRRRS
jgi:predicted nucleotidyltransferase